MDIEMAEIDILLASYNGEKYIESQLVSLVSQSFRDWRLLIHDDGSTDNTISIVKKWCAIDSRIKFVEDGIICGGAASNFMHLVRYAQANFVMFCDQDDVWFDNKIEVMYNVIKEKNNKLPQVVYANAYSWLPSEGVKGHASLSFPKNIRQFLFNNGGHQGCSSLFNYEMCILMSKWQGTCAMHDHLLQFIGLAVGEVTYIRIPLMLYRQHPDKVTKYDYTSSYVKKIFCNARPVISIDHYMSIKRLYAMLCHTLSIRDKRLVEIYLHLPRVNKIYRFILIAKTGFSVMNSRLRLLVKVLKRPYYK